jgi:hypothetical protein
MRCGTLNVDPRLNAFRREYRVLRPYFFLENFTCPLVRKDARALFDKGGFVLLPDEDVVQKYGDGGKHEQRSLQLYTHRID